MTQHEVYSGEDQKKYHFLFMISAKEAVVDGDHVLTLSGLDHKVLFMTARPGRACAFVPVGKYLHTWAKNHEIFLEAPPQVAIIHSDMKEDAHGKAKAIPVQISHPREIGPNNWVFDSKLLAPGKYNHIVLFLDWPASLECPEPILLEVPALFGRHHV